MDEQKYEKLAKILSDVKEDVFEKYEQVKFLFQRFIFLSNKIPEKAEIWFEKKEIKKDSEYYEIIIKIIDSFLKYCEKKESFNVELLSKEINDIFEKSKFSCYYECMLEISKLFDNADAYFIEIISGLLCLGFKKESAINNSFIDSIKEFVQDERIEKSIYSPLLNDIDYQNIAQDFMINMKLLLSLILTNGNEEKIKSIIKKLKKSEESKDQRKSSVSTNFENNEEESKYDNNNNKSEEELLSTKNNKESSPTDKNIPAQSQNSLNSSPSEIKEEPKSIEKTSSFEEQINAEIKEEDNKNTEKKITFQNGQEEKKNEQIQGVPSQQGDKSNENNIPKQDISKLKGEKPNNDIIVNISEICTKFEDFNQLFESKVVDSKKNEKVENKDKDEFKQEVSNVVLSILDRFNKYNILLQKKSEFIYTSKDYYLTENFQNEITEVKATIEKLEIQLNEIKSINKYLLPANIVNIKRKILETIIYSILKKNEESFELNKNYCPNNSFLDKILDRLINFSKSDNLSDNQKIKLNAKIQFINDLKLQDNSSINFPFYCKNEQLRDILNFFSFYKKELNDIVHISKEAMQYYLLPFNKEINPKLEELFNALNNEIKNSYKENDNSTNKGNKQEEEEDSSELPINIKIDIDIALDILLNDKFGKESYISYIEQKLEDVDKKRKEILSKYSEKRKNGYKLLYDVSKNSSKETNVNMESLSEGEKSFINEVINDFKGKLSQLKTILSSLNDAESKKANYKIIEEFFEKFTEIYKKELDFDSNSYYSICQTVQWKQERNALVFFVLNIKKYELANSFLKEISNQLDEYYVKEKNGIFILLNELKNETSILIQEVDKLTQMKSAKTLYTHWKSLKFGYKKLNFVSFVNLIKSYASSIEVSLNNDVINDKVTSLWIIKNDLTEFVV